jgi:hypothetical protein
MALSIVKRIRGTTISEMAHGLKIAKFDGARNSKVEESRFDARGVLKAGSNVRKMEA